MNNMHSRKYVQIILMIIILLSSICFNSIISGSSLATNFICSLHSEDSSVVINTENTPLTTDISTPIILNRQSVVLLSTSNSNFYNHTYNSHTLFYSAIYTTFKLFYITSILLCLLYIAHLSNTVIISYIHNKDGEKSRYLSIQ